MHPPCLPNPVFSPQVRAALQQSFPSFEIVEFTGDGTIVSQLEAFATASVVVGPHGAGLSNIVVSSLHTPVLEIGPISCSTCFLHLAIKVGLLLAADKWGLVFCQHRQYLLLSP